FADGAAAFTTSFPDVGSHTVGAAFNGFALGAFTFSPSAAAPLTEVISPPPPPPPPPPRFLDGVGTLDPTTNTFFLRASPDGGLPDAGAFGYGLPFWYPVAGDWNGDGFTDIGVIDLGTETWFLRLTDPAVGQPSGGLPDAGVFQYGLP